MLRCHSSYGCLYITRHSCIGDGGGGLMTSDSLRVLPQQVTYAPMDRPTPRSVWAAQTEARARTGSWEGLGKRWEALGGVKCLDTCCAYGILKNVIKTLY